MNIKIYADGSRLNEIVAFNEDPRIAGFTTNPTLMRKAGVTDYTEFIKEVLGAVKEKPISFEIFADEFDAMEYQVRKLAEFGENVYVKIPVTNTKGQLSYGLIERVTSSGVKVNVTAVFTPAQVRELNSCLNPKVPSIVSIFAGRIADTGVDPVPLVKSAVANKIDNCDILWASTRTVYNVYEANRAGCDIITVTTDLLGKLNLGGKDLAEYSLETVKMFYDDAQAAGYTL